MPEYNKVIDNLNRKLFFKFNKIRVVPNEDGEEQTLESFVKTAFSMHYGGNRDVSTSSVGNVDVDSADAVDDEYVTNTPHHIRPDHDLKIRPEKDSDEKQEAGEPLVDLDGEDSEIREQDEEAPAPEEAPEEAPAEDPMADMGDPGMGADPGMGGADPGMGADPMAGMPGMQEEPKTPNELGRTYEMKKIYSRLVAMNQYLADEMSPKIYKTKQSIGKAIDLFSVIGANPDSYKDKIDEIIISYYKFLESAYRRVKSHYKSESIKIGGLPLPKNPEQKDDKDTEVTI